MIEDQEFNSNELKTCTTRRFDMTRRRIGNSDLAITPIGIGAWAMGGSQWEWSWGPQNDSDSLAAIYRGLDLGLNWIDTAAVYGLGHSEIVVGRALKGMAHRPYVFTKCSLIWDVSGQISHSLQRDSIHREVEASLKRLDLEQIDLYQIHWPAWKGAPESASPGSIEEAVGALAELQQQGKIRYIGASNFDTAQLKRAFVTAPISSLQPPYSLLERASEKSVLPFAQANQVGVIVYSPMYSGLLSGSMTEARIARLAEDDWRKRNPNFQQPLLARNLRLVETLRKIGSAHGLSAGEVAIAWTLRNPAVTGAIVGVRNPSQINGIIGGATLRLDGEELSQIERGLALEAA
jgi:aryl-alcohol dehydrogenase-like predicted oxidoreductase